MIVDLFAGPGGWDVGAALAGLEQPIGIEWDQGACNTRAAAGHLTIRADVAAYPAEVFAGADGLIASPPCQEFSVANRNRRGADSDRGALVHQVMRWVTIIRPRWIACEQVPPVLPIWKAYAHQLAELGYRTRACLLNAADYGVPQLRKRAILIAHREHVVLMPEPTHSRTGNGRRRWVTMADALGWGHGNITPISTRGAGIAERHGDRPPFTWDAPAPTIRANHGKPSEWAGTHLVHGSWADGRGGNRRTYDLDETAPTVSVGHDAAGWVWRRPATTIQGDRRVWPPGHKLNADDIAHGRTGGDRAGTDAVRVTEPELGILQGFPADYPWRGPRIAQQIGNAVPPPLAAAILGALTS